MCKKVTTKRNGKDFDICAKTRKPLVTHNIFGDFCEDACDFEIQVFARTRAEMLVEDMGPIFEQLKEK